MKPLTSKQEKQLKTILQSLKAGLQKTLQQTSESAQPVHLDQQAFGRVSRGGALQQQSMAKASEAHIKKRLQMTIKALKRFEADEYGFCPGCDQSIGFPRLEARPETPLCIQCQSKAEQRR
ncbi:hypothetical protein GZ77_22660 [Endozoicomonas montiporae]|uniref:Zinc finger DksA/TraR C4-type domain-containing protein n=2 Tax=Endozoicomonas montiporae TaxID=1027273 RepID=A0A081N0E3_9GAMM|nr:TraR/DksA family transcriptional regulator [Endozoicomonas montiporae]AMO54371.1 RNA polymerase binding protein DksA [Endozoicomonas montiporae CL-33]KEQ11916.1 hypothetical protein GZ77_22660 [Endozoicomonas montiporae]